MSELEAKLDGINDQQNSKDLENSKCTKKSVDKVSTDSFDNSSITPEKLAIFGLLGTILLASILINISLLVTGEGAVSNSTGSGFWVSILGLIILSAASLSFAFWAYFIRPLYIDSQLALVPEKWGAVIVDLIKSSQNEHLEVKKIFTETWRTVGTQAEKSEELLESFLTLQQTLNEKDKEILRLKEGYDSKVFKKFLNRFIRIDRSLREMVAETKDEPHLRNYRYLSRLMEDALDECGVEIYRPNPGSDYRDAGPQIADEPKIIDTEDDTKDFNIAGVESDGYILEGQGKIEVIMPAKVSIYRAISKKTES